MRPALSYYIVAVVTGAASTQRIAPVTPNRNSLCGLFDVGSRRLDACGDDVSRCCCCRVTQHHLLDGRPSSAFGA